MNRREFIGVASAVWVVPDLRAADVVLFDARYGVASAHAAVLRQRGFLALATNQDVVRLWYENRALRIAPGIAGLTPHSDFEIVRQLLKNKRLVSFERLRAHDRPGSLVSWRFA
jgi:hypothetical protein